MAGSQNIMSTTESLDPEVLQRGFGVKSNFSWSGELPENCPELSQRFLPANYSALFLQGFRPPPPIRSSPVSHFEPFCVYPDFLLTGRSKSPGKTASNSLRIAHHCSDGKIPRLQHCSIFKYRSTERSFVRVGSWQNGFFADFYFLAAGVFFADFVAGFFLHIFVGKKCPEKSSSKIPDKILENLCTNQSPRHSSAEGPGQPLGTVLRHRMPCVDVSTFAAVSHPRVYHSLEVPCPRSSCYACCNR